MAPAAGPSVADHNVVFVDTSLDTHLAIIVSESDTVSDFKRNIMLEHRQLFPAIGDIRVECMKIKRRGSFYHLSDSMLVKTAFGAAKRNWFVSVDASRLEQNDDIQHLGKHKVGDQLALPWVTHSRSIERHDNNGSPSTYSKIVPFVNQKVFNIDQVTSGDSCKDVSKNVVGDRSSNDKQLDYELQDKLYTVNTDISSKKRTRDVHDESSLKDDFEAGPSVKKKRKTQRVKSNVKASEEKSALTYDNDKVNDNGVNISNEDSLERKLKGKDSSDENNRTTDKDENWSALDQVAAVVPDVEGVGSGTVEDVAMVVENNIQKEVSAEMFQKDKDSELIREPARENEKHSSLMVDADGVSAAGRVTRSTKLQAAEKEVFSTSFIKELHNTKKDIIESSTQQAVGSNGQEYTGDQIDKYKDDSEISLRQRPELKLPERKKGSENIGERKRRKTKKLFKHPDSLVGDISSAVPASVTDEIKMNEDSEKAIIDGKKGDDVMVEKVEVIVEDKEEKPGKEFTDTNDVVTVTNEDNILPHFESLMNNDAEKSTAKQNEKTDDATKKRKKRKTKKTDGRNVDESITKHVNGDICENVKEGDMSSTVLALVADQRKMNAVAEETLIDAKKGDDVIMKAVEMSLENIEEKSRKETTDANDADLSAIGENISQVYAQGILDNLEKPNEKAADTLKKKKKRKTRKSDEGEPESKKSQSVDHHLVPEKTLKNVAASEVSKVNNGDDIPDGGSQDLNFRHYFAPSKVNNEVDNKNASIDNRKDMKKTKDDSRSDQSQKLVSESENNKVSINVSKDANIDKMKTPKRTKKIDVQKTNKQAQSISGQTRVNTVKKKSVNGSQQVKSLLSTPVPIFGGDNDDSESVNSDSSTHTPSRKLSSSSSSSEDSASSKYPGRSRSRAREGQGGAGKTNISTQSKSRIISINDVLRRSSGFKKAKVTASSQLEDTESQPVDFVPDSQPMF